MNDDRLLCSEDEIYSSLRVDEGLLLDKLLPEYEKYTFIINDSKDDDIL